MEQVVIDHASPVVLATDVAEWLLVDDLPLCGHSHTTGPALWMSCGVVTPQRIGIFRPVTVQGLETSPPVWCQTIITCAQTTCPGSRGGTTSGRSTGSSPWTTVVLDAMTGRDQ